MLTDSNSIFENDPPSGQEPDILSTAEHLSLSLRLCVVDWNRVFLWSCLYSLVIALCQAEQSLCSIKLWHIHLSHSLWSDRKPRADAQTHTLGCNSRKYVPVCSTYCFIVFWCQNRTKCIFTCCVVWTWTWQCTAEKLLKKIQSDTFKWKRKCPKQRFIKANLTFYTVSDQSVNTVTS